MSTVSNEREREAIAGFLSERTEERFCALFDAFYRRPCRYFVARGVNRSSAEELAEDENRAAELPPPRAAVALPTVEYEPLARRPVPGGHARFRRAPGAKVSSSGSLRIWITARSQNRRVVIQSVFFEANRRFRDVLKAKGYAVTYVEVPGAEHEPGHWKTQFRLGLLNLTASGN